MSAVEHAVESAPVIAAEPAVAVPVAEPKSASRAERIDRLHGAARDHYKLTGNVEAAEKLSNPDVTSAPSPEISAAEPAEIEAASDPAIEEQPRQGETPAEKSERKKRNDHARYVKEKTRADLLERQLAEMKGTSALPKTPEPAKEAPPKLTERPKRPSILDPKYTGDNALADYEKDMVGYDEAIDVWNDQKITSREMERTQQQSHQQAESEWNGQLTDARKEFADFDKVALASSVPASDAMIRAIQSQKDGARMMYWLGKNIREAARITELTDIPNLAQIAKDNPARAAYLVGQAEGMAKAELSRIKLTASSAAPKPKTLKEQIAGAPKPSAEVSVEANAEPAKDPVTLAIAAAKAGDQKTYNEIMNRRDLEKRKAR